jgi:hypothetical protein
MVFDYIELTFDIMKYTLFGSGLVRLRIVIAAMRTI